MSSYGLVPKSHLLGKREVRSGGDFGQVDFSWCDGQSLSRMYLEYPQNTFSIPDLPDYWLAASFRAPAGPLLATLEALASRGSVCFVAHLGNSSLRKKKRPPLSVTSPSPTSHALIPLCVPGGKKGPCHVQ